MLRGSGVRLLAIETSGPRGSVALLDGANIVASAEHHQQSAHAEQLLPLIARCFEESGWDRRSIDRLAVGVGPGSFTGLRVGIALAEGIALGLGKPLLGIGSLRAMAQAVAAADERVRVPILDARRAELFAAAYDRQGVELLAPCALPLQEARARLETLGSHLVFVGGFAEALGPDVPLLRGPDYDLPQARWVGIVASNAAVDEYPALPIYVRGAGATLPNLPPSPISSSPRGTG